MVPNSDGVDQPPAVPLPPDTPMPSAPPMPEGPAAADNPPVGSTSADDPEPASAPTAPVVTTAANDDLIKLKQEALQSLAPLVDHLDQTPEEKFKTTMMMLQASDNADLVKEAYAAANAITDEKIRAQALLDVVNEINYFTQHGADNNAQTAV